MTCRRPFGNHPFSAVYSPKRNAARGFSMTELVWVVAVIGILAAMVITSVGKVLDGSKDTAAHEMAERLNHALEAYAQTGQEITFPSNPSSASDEVVVLHYLQARTSQAGSPFLTPRYRPRESSSVDDYRLYWTGSLFKVLPKGTTGTGLQVPFDGSDLGDPWIQPADWQPYGK